MKPRSSRIPRRACLAACALAALLALAALPSGRAWAAPTAQDAAACATLADAATQLRELGVPGPTVDRILAASAEGRAAFADVRELTLTLHGAGDDNIPARLLTPKIDEGLAKNVPLSRIRAAVAREADDYRFVRGLLRAGDTDPEILRGPVEALGMGLSREDLAAFAAKAPEARPEMLATALETLGFLDQAGFPRAESERVLLTGLRRGDLGPEWLYFPRAVMQARSKGVTDARIADAAAAALDAGKGLRECMAALGFTGRDVRQAP